MIATLNALLRLLLPLFREWWRNQNWSAHSIRHLKEIHYIFLMHLVQFALLLYVIDHGLSLHLYYSNAMHKADIEASQARQVVVANDDLVSRNRQLEDQLKHANYLIDFFIGGGPAVTKGGKK